MKVNYLNEDIRRTIEIQVDEFYKFLDFVECVEQINRRYVHFSQIGFAVSYLIVKASENK